MKAFPTQIENHTAFGEQGMDLRDYFAAQAPIYLDDAFESLQRSTNTALTEKFDKEVIDELAKLSYLYADAMMVARK